MYRIAAIGLLIGVSLTAGPSAGAESGSAAPPTTYEVQINGENFLVDANRVVNLKSKQEPGVSYDVAVRVAPTQRIRLNTLQFDYEMPAKVEDDRKRETRSVRLTHEMGFSILLGDLGRPLEPEAQQSMLKLLVDSVTAELREEKATGIDISAPHQRTFDGSSARGITIRCRDAKQIAHVYPVYVLTGPTFAATCVVGYLAQDSADVLPLVKKTLDSVRAVPARR
jgi:hypothetical protein